MSFTKFLRRYQSTGFGCVVTIVAIILISSTPVLATDGRTAVGMCIDSTAAGARCAWSVNDKGEIDICNKNGCVYCPSATGQCSVASKGRPRPSKGLPEGTKVTTAVGSFEVRPHAITGPLLGVAPRKSPSSEMKKQ
jgi:hypothetical protein